LTEVEQTESVIGKLVPVADKRVLKVSLALPHERCLSYKAYKP
jgi:hypothetical protein